MLYFDRFSQADQGAIRLWQRPLNIPMELLSNLSNFLERIDISKTHMITCLRTTVEIVLISLFLTLNM